MTQYGFSLMCELHDPRSLVEQAKRAEAAGFDFVTISDHFHPWLYSHGHSPYAWSVLGGVAATTERIRMVSLVTAPIIRYHPAIVAQKAATMGAVSGERSIELALEKADGMVGIQPDSSLTERFDGKPRVGQLAFSVHDDAGEGLRLAHERVRFSAQGWKVMAELPNPINFEAATAPVRPEDMADAVPHGPDPEPYLEAIREWVDAGYDHLAFVQVGPDQEAFFRFWEEKLRPELG